MHNLTPVDTQRAIRARPSNSAAAGDSPRTCPGTGSKPKPEQRKSPRRPCRAAILGLRPPDASEDRHRPGRATARVSGRAGARARPRPRRGRGRARRAARTGGRRGRRPPRRARSSLSSSAATTTSTASSPTFARTRRALVEQLAVYEPSGRSAHARRRRARAHGAKHESEPVWHAGPARADAQQERVAVAVVAQLLDRERVAGRLALVPELLARAAPEPRLARLARQPLRLVVHPREHQHAARLRVLDDRARVEAQAASRSGTPSSRSSSRSDASRVGILVQDRREQRRLRDLERLGDVARRRPRRPRRSPGSRPRPRPRRVSSRS